jgi:hypothetical protein
MTPEPNYLTAFGKLYIGKSEELFAGSLGADLRGKVQLIFTSPPFPLNEKKQYGNLQGEDYVNWFSAFAPLFADLLTCAGYFEHLFIKIENGQVSAQWRCRWIPGQPSRKMTSSPCLEKEKQER